MNTRLKAELEAKIQQWAEENCEGNEWPQDIWTGEETVPLMAEAAMAVFNAVAESQQYAVREGMLIES